MLLGEVSWVGFERGLRHPVQFLVVGVEIGHWTLLFGCVGVGVLDTHFSCSLPSGRLTRLSIRCVCQDRFPPARYPFLGGLVRHDTKPVWWHPTGVNQIDAVRLVLQPICLPVARMLLVGETPQGLRFAPGYPSRFTHDVMESVLEARGPGRFGPYFMIRKADGMIVGEIGCSVEDVYTMGKVGYSVVEPCWGQGYATEALRALLGYVLAEPDMRRVIAETMVDHVASRRVMEKAGMTYCGERLDDEYGELVNLVVYEAFAHRTVPTR